MAIELCASALSSSSPCLDITQEHVPGLADYPEDYPEDAVGKFSELWSTVAAKLAPCYITKSSVQTTAAKSSGLNPAASEPQAVNMFAALMAPEAEEDEPDCARARETDRKSGPICPKDHSTDCTCTSGEDICSKHHSTD